MAKPFSYIRRRLPFSRRATNAAIAATVLSGCTPAQLAIGEHVLSAYEGSQLACLEHGGTWEQKRRCVDDVRESFMPLRKALEGQNVGVSD